MGDYNVDPDYDGPVYHRIVCNSTWPACPGSHEKVDQVSDCFRWARILKSDPDTHGVCGDLMWGRYDDGSRFTYPCPALRRSTARGSECEHGHEHVDIEVRQAEGWEYAEDDGEARQLAFAGVEPRTITGQVWPA